MVEHDAPVRSLLLRALESAGYPVLAATRPSEALRVLESPAQIDLLLTSVLLPEMYGTTLAARARRTRPDLRVLFISASPTHPVVVEEVLPSRDGFLAKPFTARQLIEAVRTALLPAASAG
ncbi:MAG: response regulator [Bryobacteraceae bacterium]